MIGEIERRLDGHDQELETHKKYQRTKMEAYTEKQIFDINQQAAIVKDIREFKARIEDTLKRLEDLDELMRQLNEKLIMQDMANATRLL